MLSKDGVRILLSYIPTSLSSNCMAANEYNAVEKPKGFVKCRAHIWMSTGFRSHDGVGIAGPRFTLM
ncbi:hypothetical protein BC936DRAFT_139013 [Jimgerdemannia flammicorona]|uniref:Uncharacterized protein n=1 Tax=Jimgerdemannia flammicorona TaxID=994334 RepID=A0A433BB24_9FUNG|nr:hypothetical protein BC936DRAFT_139013 [Jimgerdemannia flammicorona]